MMLLLHESEEISSSCGVHRSRVNLDLILRFPKIALMGWISEVSLMTSLVVFPLGRPTMHLIAVLYKFL